MSPLSIFVYVSALPYIIKVLTIPYQHLRLTRWLEPALMDTPSRNQRSFDRSITDRLGVWWWFREWWSRWWLRGGPAQWNERRKLRLHDYELCQGLWARSWATINQQRQCRIPVWNSKWTNEHCLKGVISAEPYLQHMYWLTLYQHSLIAHS